MERRIPRGQRDMYMMTILAWSRGFHMDSDEEEVLEEKSDPQHTFSLTKRVFPANEQRGLSRLVELEMEEVVTPYPGRKKGWYKRRIFVENRPPSRQQQELYPNLCYRNGWTFLFQCVYDRLPAGLLQRFLEV